MRKLSVSLIVWLLTASGCSQNAHVSSSIELMNAERRALEDQLYELEYQYESVVEELDELHDENASLRNQLGVKSPSRRSAPRSTPRRSDPTDDDQIDLSPPSVDEGELSIPQIELPEMGQGAELAPPGQIAISTTSSIREPIDPRITRLRINSRLTRGVDLDASPGDDGLEIVLEPLNDLGEMVVLPGPIDVVLLDYALRDQGEEARVGRWDLSATDVVRFIQDTPDEDGIRLQLLWPEGPPKHSRLRLDIRYRTLDGRNLDARRDVEVRLNAQHSRRWTPRAKADRRVDAVREPVTRDQESAPASPDPEQPSTPVARPEWKPFR
jgi:hypothetical protein